MTYAQLIRTSNAVSRVLALLSFVHRITSAMNCGMTVTSGSAAISSAVMADVGGCNLLTSTLRHRRRICLAVDAQCDVAASKVSRTSSQFLVTKSASRSKISHRTR
jgi:hypothetical protein